MDPVLYRRISTADLVTAFGLFEQVEVLAASLHGMDDELVAAIEGHDREFQESAAAVEAEDELLGRHVIVRVAGIDPVLRRVQNVRLAEAVLEC